MRGLAVEKRRVLVTGASGYIAGQLLPALRERYDLVLLDTRAEDRSGRPVEGVQIADLTNPDLDANRSFFCGIDSVVHLGYIHPSTGQGSATVESYRAERMNVDMAFHVFQLSMEEGARRVVVASSNHAADWYEHLIHAKKKDVVDPGERPLSDNFYGWAKATYEHLGFVFASGRLGRSLENVQVRIGAPRELEAARYRGNPTGFHRDLGAYSSVRDLQQLFIRSIEAEDIRDRYGVPFQVFYGISDNARQFWSIANAREVIGYAPQDDSEVKFAAGVAAILAPLGGPVPVRPYPPKKDDPSDPSRPGR
jgi:nucleoside-diphosphate-sugar epimerase